MCYFPDSSKRRRAIRGKLEAIKKKENDLFSDYIKLVVSDGNKQKILSDLQNGRFTWLDGNSQDLRKYKNVVHASKCKSYMNLLRQIEGADTLAKFKSDIKELIHPNKLLF